MKKRNTTYFLMLLLIFGIHLGYSKLLIIDPPIKKNLVPIAPSITISGNLNLTYCPQTDLNIVENVILLDPDNQINEIFIQISTNYVNGLDQLKLANPSLHPKIKAGVFDTNSGKLRIYNADATTTLSDFEAAIKDIQFRNDSPTSTGTRNFSITIGQANYLPRNKHFYKYISKTGITWAEAKAEAESSTNYYYGLKGYLATLTAEDEAQLAGAQAAGAGWIGGSDAEVEGVWKWVTGPEAGTVMTYTNWNSGGEPNDYGDGVGSENYAHITTPGMINGIKGSWNDLPNQGDPDPKSAYYPLGYIVEYGGLIPGDVDTIKISASTALTIAKITSATPATRCDTGEVTLNATTSIGTIDWYDVALGGSKMNSGTSFTTPTLISTTNYYAEIAGCPATRTKITATINSTPIISTTKPTVSRCGSGTVDLEATVSIGNINWFTDVTGGTPIGTGAIFTTPTLLTDSPFYAEGNNNGCLTNRLAFSITINPVPVVSNESVILCESSNIELDASLFGMTYLWSTSEITKTITVATAGTYYVDITNSYFCTSTRTITVIEHQIPVIDTIRVEETAVEIVMQNPESYFEYSFDGFNYQSSNLFSNASAGLQTAYVREINGCGTDSKDFVVLLAPAFFTPNNDSFNDFWTVKGISSYPKAELRIFDRYGKLLKELRPTSLGWDGTFNGQELPASDYWFVFKMDANSPEKRGHFALKR
jgi:gliding motility-associated-like protein